MGEPRVGRATSEGPLIGLQPLSDFKAESLLKVLMKLQPILLSTSDLLCHFFLVCVRASWVEPTSD